MTIYLSKPVLWCLCFLSWVIGWGLILYNTEAEEVKHNVLIGIVGYVFAVAIPGAILMYLRDLP